MTISAKILPNYTYDDYCQWEGMWELIDGIPYSMSPMPSPLHQRISSEILTEFSVLLKQNKCSCTVYQPIDLKIDEHTVLNPDLLIVCEPIEKQFLDFPPQLVVEILSPSTRLKDLNTKFELYQNFGIPYYIIVDPDNQTIAVYILKSNGIYEVLEKPYRFLLNDSCCIEPDFSGIW